MLTDIKKGYLYTREQHKHKHKGKSKEDIQTEDIYGNDDQC